MVPVSVMHSGEERIANTTTENVIHVVTDVLDQTTLIVLAVYQMPSVILMEIVSVNQESGR
jgi:hypothetical protein